MLNFMIVGFDEGSTTDTNGNVAHNEQVLDYVETVDEIEEAVKQFEDQEWEDVTPFKIFPLNTKLYSVRWLGTKRSEDKVFKGIEELRKFANRLYCEENASEDDNEIYFEESDFEEIVEWLELHDEDYVVTEIDLDKV